MTQSFTSDNHLSHVQSLLGQDKSTANGTDSSAHRANSTQPAIVHPNFDPSQTPLDPARPLTDIPEPARRGHQQLRRLYGKSVRFYQPREESLSKWQLVESEPFAEHLALLSAAKLIELPDSFYRPYQNQWQHSNQGAQSLLSSLEHMTLLDMADIQAVTSQYPKLTRYGFQSSAETASVPHNDSQALSLHAIAKRHNPDELLNGLYADDWQVILQPQQFDTGVGSLATDIMACSVAVHALKQCSTRKSINHSYDAEQLCRYIRSYLLSQVNLAPTQRHAYRQIRLFSGHIIVAAVHLGWSIHISKDGQCYFNISSRSRLLTRYADMQSYYINGWSS
ncbi:hypothetical protein J3492_06625 [Psychrobacter sp. F1192]|uniref:Uncharacterized protein n=1 Tax=Psychrobacter coccoides TaxID=2818440 RepID=A0ABS3NNF2_9GAMM|nr:hypothetical protein [Psychrobacter coccoides]MBO1530888.1 hypothetical protein [Psychrobacter coccoides]